MAVARNPSPAKIVTADSKQRFSLRRNNSSKARRSRNWLRHSIHRKPPILTTSETTTDSSANGHALSDVPLSGFRQQELEKIALLLEETDELIEPVE